jgi:hypothetical protein
MDTTTIIRLVAGLLFLCVLAAGIAYLAFLSGVLAKCSPQSRTMQPGMVWLSLIPFFNLIWTFFVVSAIADSLGNEFRLRRIPTSDPKPAKSLGIAMAICRIIPLVNIVALFLWIFYWVKVAGYSRQLELAPSPTGTTGAL